MTTKLSDLREALELYDAAEFKSEVSWPQPPIVAAARRFLALTETGRKFHWCKPHDSPMSYLGDECYRKMAVNDDEDQRITTPCSVVSKWLSDYTGEAT